MGNNRQFSNNNNEPCEIDGISHGKGGWTFLLLLTGISFTIGSAIPTGFNIGVLNSQEDVIKSFCNNSLINNYDYHIEKSGLTALWSTVVSIFIFGGVIGSLQGSQFADKFGRKNSMLISNIISLVAAVLYFFCRSIDRFEILLIARFMAGLSGGLTTSVLPMYLQEIAPVHIKGIMGVLAPFGMTFGVFYAQVLGLKQFLGAEEIWHVLISFYGIQMLICTLIIPMLPESPKYLFLTKHNQKLAIKELSRIRSLPPEQLTSEIQELQEAQKLQSENSTEWSIGLVLKEKTLRLQLLLVCALQAGQQFSGINAVFYYSVSIFKNAGLSEDNSKYASIGASGINAVVSIIVLPFMSKVGRRPLTLFSNITSVAFLIILCGAIQFINVTSWMPFVCIASVLLFVVFFQIGLGPVPYFIGSELFDVGPRPAAMALGSMANWGGNLFVGLSFPTMQETIGSFSFLVFATILIALFFFLLKYLPETLNRPMNEISRICARGLKSNPLSHNILDEMDIIEKNRSIN